MNLSFLKIFLAVPAFLGATLAAQAQKTELGKDKQGHKMLTGLISRQDLTGDTAFGWFAPNAKDFKPYPPALQSLKQNKDSVNFIVFGGTWCHDTHFILPRFFTLMDAAGVAPDRVTVIAVDENKKSTNHLPEALNITNVPTIIVMKKGKEIGRVIEYGKQGVFDKELGEIVSEPGLGGMKGIIGK